MLLYGSGLFQKYQIYYLFVLQAGDKLIRKTIKMPPEKNVDLVPRKHVVMMKIVLL